MLIERPRRLLFSLLFCIGIFNLTDYFLTLKVIAQGHEEANPLIAAILDTIYFPIIKLIIIPLLLIFIWKVRNRIHKRLILYVWMVFISYFSLMIYFKIVFF